MSDNARFHNKLHRKNHHTLPTAGYPDSATDPIASQAEPFQGDFHVDGNIHATGAILSIYSTLSNINIPVPVLSANVGFQPSNALVVELAGTKYAIPVTLIGDKTFTGSQSGINSLSASTTQLGNTIILGALSGTDSDYWNSLGTLLANNSATWVGGNSVYTSVLPNSGKWDDTYTVVRAGSANWEGNYNASTYVANNSATFDQSYTVATYAKLSAQPYTFFSDASSIVANSGPNNTPGCFITAILAGYCNTASGNYSVIVGGGNNTASGFFGTVVNGTYQTASGCNSFIGNGYANTVNGDYSSILGGNCNNIFGLRSAILGGDNNTLSGNDSFALGSNITSDLSNYTLVNNISSQGASYSLSAYSSYIGVGDSTTSSLSSFTSAAPVALFISNNANSLQITQQNLNSGTCASTDFVATADNGTETTNYVDLGIGSSTYSNPAFELLSPNDAYLYVNGGNLTIGTATSGDLVLHTGGTLATNERVRLTYDGGASVGTASCSANITIYGDISATGNIYASSDIYRNGAGQCSILPIRNDASIDQTGCYSFIGGGNCNTVSGPYGVIGGGYQNSAGCYSFIGGGSNNIDTGRYTSIFGGLSNCNAGTGNVIIGGCYNTIGSSLSGVYILGTNITPVSSDYTYTSNINNSGILQTNNATITNGITAYCSNIFWSCGCVSQYTTGIYNNISVDVGESTFTGDLILSGRLYLANNDSKNKYTTLLGDNVLSSFTITHNLSTYSIFTTVYNTSARQLVYPEITLDTDTQLSVKFSSIPPLTAYRITVLGFPNSSDPELP